MFFVGFFFFFLALVHCFYLHNHPLAEHKAKMRDGDHPVQFSSAEGLLSDQLTDGVHFVCAHFLSNSHAFISPNLRKEVCGYVTTYILSLNWSPKLFKKLYSSSAYWVSSKWGPWLYPPVTTESNDSNTWPHIAHTPAMTNSQGKLL